jgi:hypothetical protein
MKITSFNQLIAKNEGLKKQVNIAQIGEIVRIIDKLTLGILYKLIRLIPEPKK